MTLLTLLPDVSGAAWIPFADAILKATLLLASAGLASVALRRQSAAARHLVWTLALLSAMVLPALSIALPRWQVPLVTLQSASVAPVATGTTSFARVAPALRASRTQADATPAQATAASVATRFVLPRISIGAALLLIWAFGAVLVLGRLAIGLAAVQWMSRRTGRVTDAPWLPLARELAGELGVSPRILFLRSPCASMPMAWGVIRPSVVMPADADTWPAERLRIVLLHELAHVKRRDCLTHMLAQVTCALYWFNPLAWMAARHVRTERERACDDLVLAAGTRGAEYANQLLEIARGMRAGRFPGVLAGASLAMAHRSQLEGRLMAILDPTVARSGLSRLRTAGATVVFACAVMPLASMQPWAYAAEPKATADAAVSSSGAARGNEATAQSTDVRVSTHVATHAQVVDKTAIRESVRSAMPNDLGSLIDGVLEGVVQPAVTSALGSLGKAAQDSKPGIRSGKSAADPKLVAALTAALKDTDKDVRETALHALVQLRDPSIFEPLLEALKDGAADMREQAAFGLGQLHDRRAVEPLMAALKDQNADVREQAVFALGQLHDVAAVDGLAVALHDEKPNVREQAAFSLGQIRDPKAVPGLISALKDSTSDVREQAAFALGQLCDRSAVEALVIALKDSDADVREQAAFALGQIRDPRAIDGLTTALKDPSADVRQQAAFALGQIAR